MLLYSTILDITDDLTPVKFIELVIEWNNNSQYPENTITGIEWNGEHNIRYEDGSLSLEFQEYGNINAVRFEKKADDDAIWDTDYIMNFDEMKMAIRLDRSYTDDALRKNLEFSTPYFVALLIKNSYLKNDSDLPVFNKPIIIRNDNINLLADVINGKKTYQLPIVYVSKTFLNKDPVDVKHLCSRLKGAAHVLQESDMNMNSTIRSACKNNNEYGGRIGIFSRMAGTENVYIVERMTMMMHCWNKLSE